MTELLIVTNGYKDTRQAVEYGAWFANAMRMKITLLGVTEKLNPAAIDDHHPLEDIFEEAVGLFKEQGVEYRLEVQNGDAEHVISAKANSRDYITMVSPLGRPQIKRWLTGRSIRPLMEKIIGPILYVPQVRLPLKKVMVCAGGLGYVEAAESLAMQISVVNHADVTILHVVPPADFDYPSTRGLRDHMDDLADTDTLPGRNLRKALDMAKNAGLNAHVVTRQGQIVEEILAEIKAGEYDLVCMGSPYSAHSLRQLYVPNVTAEVAEVVHCPVLTARFKPVQVE
jgi:nucleotide-binding universal stress UspA family protein